MTKHLPTILVVEDEPQMREFVVALLESHEYRPVAASSGSEAISLATQYRPDVILLDLGLPDIDGIDVIRRLRKWTQTPIIVLSVRDREQDKIAALDEGADDYLTKPFGSGELQARIRVALRHLVQRDSDDESAVVETGDLRVDHARRRAFLDGAPLELTDTEYRLLSIMIRHVGKVLTYRFLLKEVWGPGYVERNHYVRIYMARLRDKLKDDPAHQHYIVTETGVGYRLRDHSSS